MSHSARRHNMFERLSIAQLLRLINKTEKLLDTMESKELSEQLDELNNELHKRWNDDNLRRIKEEMLKQG